MEGVKKVIVISILLMFIAGCSAKEEFYRTLWNLEMNEYYRVHVTYNNTPLRKLITFDDPSIHYYIIRRITKEEDGTLKVKE